MAPTVSIIMATYNRAHLIEETLHSIFCQSYPHWECLIIDDGSTDDTDTVLQPYLEKEPRIKYYQRQENHQNGLPGCRNYGLELATGTYVIFFDDDDIVHPDNLLHCVATLEQSSYDFCRYIRDVFHGNFNVTFNREPVTSTFEITKNDLYEIISGALPFNSCAVMWKKELFKSDIFKEDLMYAEEWELYTRIIANGAEGVSLNKTLFYGRKHSNSNTGEYYNNDPIRLQSKSMAVKEVARTLASKNMLSYKIMNHLMQLGFYLKDISVIETVSKEAKLSSFKRIKYRSILKFFPLIAIYIKMKKRVRNFFSNKSTL